MSEVALPAAVQALAAELAGVAGVVAVVLGGSRARGADRPDSDWDLGVYYRGTGEPLCPGDIRALGHAGHVSELGEWGPIINGGAWLAVGELPVDVLYRDLDAVEAWRADAEQGRFDVLVQNGYIVGAPTYLPVGELALCRTISGDLPRPRYPEPLARAATVRWRGRAAVSLMFAVGHARLGDPVCCTGMLVDAILSEAHARLAARREWVLTEKALVRQAGLDGLQRVAAAPGGTPDELTETAHGVAAALGVAPLSAR
ncbi:MAG: nucleotidyltransferase domain-containing protein [Solirubrobacteraceae bacterium]